MIYFFALFSYKAAIIFPTQTTANGFWTMEEPFSDPRLFYLASPEEASLAISNGLREQRGGNDDYGGPFSCW